MPRRGGCSTAKRAARSKARFRRYVPRPPYYHFFLSQSGKNRKKWRPYIAAAKFNLNLTLICCSNYYIINIISRKHTKYCRKLTCFNIIYARRNYFTSHSSCDIAVTWQPKQPCHFSVSLNSVKDAYYELMVRTMVLWYVLCHRSNYNTATSGPFTCIYVIKLNCNLYDSI